MNVEAAEAAVLEVVHLGAHQEEEEAHRVEVDQEDAEDHPEVEEAAWVEAVPVEVSEPEPEYSSSHMKDFRVFMFSEEKMTRFAQRTSLPESPCIMKREYLSRIKQQNLRLNIECGIPSDRRSLQQWLAVSETSI